MNERDGPKNPTSCKINEAKPPMKLPLHFLNKEAMKINSRMITLGNYNFNNDNEESYGDSDITKQLKQSRFNIRQQKLKIGRISRLSIEAS